MSDDLKDRVRMFFDEIVSGGRMDGLEAVFHEDAVMHSPMGELHGLEQIGALGLTFKAALPDGRIHVEEIAVEGDVLAYRVVGEGTHEGKFAGVPGTGRHVRWSNNDLARLRDGKIAEMWGGPDMFAILTQIGAIPQPAAAG
ncbi:MAG TPA: ester cyclase [Thermoleophilia bacterium]|nr:ester cyclase [Thermoleophilia bacterium]